MTTKKKVITNDAKYREDFKKAVDAEVELRMRAIKNSSRTGETADELRGALRHKAMQEAINESTDTDPFEGLTASQHINPKNIDKDNTDLFFNVGNKPGGVYATSQFPTEVKRHYDKMLKDLESFPITPAMTGKPSSQFHSRASETMGYIDSLSTIVDEFIDALSPILTPNPGNIENVPVQTNDTISSEFNEFLSCAERRIDSIRAKISEAMGRRTI